ncbi:alpha-L-rhamnosidase [Niabella terrae]
MNKVYGFLMFPVLAGLFLMAAGCHTGSKSFLVGELTVEGRDTLLGSDIMQPRFSWILQSTGHNLRQTAYQIRVASSIDCLESGKADIWDSGKTLSDSSVNIVYKGSPLKSYQNCYWQVTVWSGDQQAESAPSYWSMGLLPSGEWKARWIGLDSAGPEDAPDSTFTRLAARYLRKEFTADKKIASANVYLSGMGLYELMLNGHKVGQDVLAPTVSEYNKTIYYNTYDITSALQSGINCLGVILGNGRFFAVRNYHGQPNPLTQIEQAHYGLPQLLLQLRIVYEDSTVDWIQSDESWKVTDQGPIRANNEFDGEVYNANREMIGWSKPGYNDQHWRPVDLMHYGDSVRIVAQPNENIRVKEVLNPLSIHRTPRGTYIVDMGQNMVGWLAIQVNGQQGDTIRMRFAETLKSPDSLYTDNLRDAKATDLYILKGGTTENWEPKFTYHGFRYAEIEGLRVPPAASQFQGKVVYDDLATIGNFETSDSTINAIYRNAYWTIRGNYRGMPTDCPQRDERVGWLGDRVISSYGESFLFDNSRFYAKWLDDIRDSQKPSGSIPDIAPSFWVRYADNVTYPSAFILIPEMLRRQFGDNRSIEKQYPAMKKWMLYMWNTYRDNDLILKDNYGDWCVPPESPEIIWTQDPKRITEGGLLASAYYYYCLGLMQQYASMMGQEADRLQFEDIASKVLTAFNKKFYNSAQQSYSNNTVTANLLPLSFGMVPEGDRQAVFHNILERLHEFDDHVNSGIIGGMWLMRGLTDNGAGELAYKLATNTSYPSWGYMVKQGATTIWELWNGDAANPMMNSGNHQMLLGDLLIWYYEYLAGIKTDSAEVAFKKIIMNPIFPKELDYVKASLHTKYGLVKSAWEKSADRISWKIVIPANSSAEITLPGSVDSATESGRPLSESGWDVKESGTGKTVISVGSGTYHFMIKK